MLDVFHMYSGSTAVMQQWFYPRGNDWQPYHVPRGCSQIFMFAIGAGGGGGGGLTGATGTTRGGGSGGGSAAATKSIFPRFSLSDLIFIQPGSGVGTGGVASGNALNGGNTYIAIEIGRAHV